ncbi:MAG TPA: vitamin B12-dependent ribonucleotide reductase [Kiritimatiellia bacterium]|nr:vitamin B12-dependent ribonucleotide reductase [Kiritimatiellia bacterium]HMO99869.1 vitamin B12-dependent ribonucleotide reductase [Kiritimatiellia bacterium]HMP96740.1 vitamin B12-dependent ribonucleotide reductase [Kiritimatiellia bacterium]
MLDTRATARMVIKNRTSAAKTTNPRGANRKGAKTAQPTKGLTFRHVFSTPGVNPFDQVEWDKRKASITDDKGKVIFEQNNVEIPKSWSMLATNVVASKYFYGDPNKNEREYSVRQLIHRVSRTIANWGIKDGYFKTADDAEAFYNELTWLCLHQYGAFNSPVWFNCGLYHEYGIGKESGTGNFYWDALTATVKQASTQYEYPQCSACFIQSVDDTMESIMELARSEAMLFKFGSGTGSDLSTIRSAREVMSGGGKPSGPLSFLRVYDAIASVVKSGGKTRRAAKMNTLKDWHPDIKEFIEAKPGEEKKAWALIEQGYAGDFNGEAYGSVCFQNENLSVRVTDKFLQAVIDDKDWQTRWVTNPSKPGPTYKARDLLKWIAEGTWLCGDPGMQYEDTIQRWHTCKAAAPINSSNPCSEYMFLDDTACNLASLNLMKFMKADGQFDVEKFKAAVRVYITAQEIIVDNASYPTEDIARNSHIYRTLGLGYANLGGLLMSLGLPYDSEEGRSIAASLTAIMHCHAYTQSAAISADMGPFADYERNRAGMLEVMGMHRDAAHKIHPSCPAYLRDAARQCADEAVELGKVHGYRNAQVTVLAPTGTIGFMMDCDTTGVEPDIALVKYKLLAGGGMLKIVNRTVRPALERLGYGRDQITKIIQYIDEHDTIEGAPDLKDEHLEVFDCAFKPRNGFRYIPYTAHVRMMAAVQPFLSGAISKTVNMPNEATPEEISQTYLEGWRLGLKALAIYRDGCKRSQPVNTGKSEAKKVEEVKVEDDHHASGNGSKARPLRRRMPSTRRSVTHKFDIAGHEGYLTVGLYDDSTPGELFITMAKEGSTVGGLMDAFGTAISMCLQYGVPVKSLVEKFAHTRFEPSGFTKNPDIPIAKSLPDYIFRWFGQTFMDGYREPSTAKALTAETDSKATLSPAPAAASTETLPPPGKPVGDKPRIDDQFQHFMEDAPVCDNCGSITVRNGACYRCFNCGNSMGCS